MSAPVEGFWNSYIGPMSPSHAIGQISLNVVFGQAIVLFLGHGDDKPALQRAR